MRFVIAIPMLLAAVFAAEAIAAPSGQKTPCPAEGSFTTLPTGIDLDGANRVWCWLKQQVGAPLELPPPRVFVGNLPSNKYSVFVFPTVEAPDSPFSIEIAWNTLKYDDHIFVLWALGHELAHSLFTLRSFDFKMQTMYPAELPQIHHCDPEFRRMTREVTQVLWDIWHSSDQTSRILKIDNDINGRQCAFGLNSEKAKKNN